MWVKLEDGFVDHPKIVRLTLAARWAYVEALCYAARYTTDGTVPSAQVRRFSKYNVMRELLDAGLWEPGKDGIAIHDYLDYNPSCAEVAKQKQERSKAGSKGAAKRWQS